MGYLDYENYDDTGHLFTDNVANNEDSTFDVLEYGGRQQSSSMIQDLESNLGDSLFELDVEKMNIRSNMHPVDRKILKKAFRCLVISYHESVRDSVMNTLSLMYSRKHYIQLVVRSLWIPARKKKLKEMLNDAQTYSLREFIYRWRLYVLTIKEVKENEVKANLFYQSSLRSKAFKGFKSLIKYNNLKIFRLTKMASIIENMIIHKVLKPWNDMAKNQKRLVLCEIDIKNSHNRYMKEKTFLYMYKMYKNRVGAYILEEFTVYYQKKVALNQLILFHQYLVEKQLYLDKKIKLVWVERFFDHWRFLSMYRSSCNYRDFKLKWKSFKNLREYKNKKYIWRKKYEIVKEDLKRERSDIALRIMVKVYTDRVNRRRLVTRMTEKIEEHLKRRTFEKLYENHKKIKKEEENEEKAQKFRKLNQFNMSMRGFYNYMEKRRNKRGMMTLTEESYKRYLLSYVFDHMIEVYREKEIKNRNIVSKFEKRRRDVIKKEYFKELRLATVKIRRLTEQYDCLWNNYNKYLANMVLKTIQNIIRVNHERKLKLITSISGDEEGNLKGLRESKINVRALMAATKPLKSESLAFLLYLLALKSRFNEVYYSYFSNNEDELINKVMKTMTKEKLEKIKSNYSLLLHETRLQYISHHAPYESSTEEYFKNLPSEIEYLLQYLILEDQFNLSKTLNLENKIGESEQEEIESYELSGYKLLNLPLWRILNIKLLLGKKRKMFEYWRFYKENKIIKRQKDKDYYESFSEMGKMFIKIRFFNTWVDLISEIKERRNEMERDRHETLEKIINKLKRNKLALGYVCIKLLFESDKRLEEFDNKIKHWSVNFIKNNPDFKEVQIITNYIKIKRIFETWKDFSNWYQKIKKDARDFNRINILVKSFKIWFTSTMYQNKKREQIGEQIKKTKDSIIKYQIFEEMYKLSKLYKILEKNNYQRNLALKTFQYWKWYSDKEQSLRIRQDLINRRWNIMIVNNSINKWCNQLIWRVRDREINKEAEQHYYTTTVEKYMKKWYENTKKRVYLKECERRISEMNQEMSKEYCLSTLSKVWKLQNLHRRIVGTQVFTSLKVMTFASKLEKLVEKRLESNKKVELREFYNLIKHNQKYHKEIEEIIKNKNNLYSILHRLSNLNNDRIVQGLRVLNTNAYYKTRFNLIKERRNLSMKYKYFTKWNELSKYNIYWVNKIEKIYTNLKQLQGPKESEESSLSFEHNNEYETSKHYQLKLLKMKQTLKLLKNIMSYWKKKCHVLNLKEEELDQINKFKETNRVIESLRALHENRLVDNCRRMYELKIENIVNNRNFKVKRAVFNYIKSQIQTQMDQLLMIEDYRNIILQDQYLYIEDIEKEKKFEEQYMKINKENDITPNIQEYENFNTIEDINKIQQQLNMNQNISKDNSMNFNNYESISTSIDENLKINDDENNYNNLKEDLVSNGTQDNSSPENPESHKSGMEQVVENKPEETIISKSCYEPNSFDESSPKGEHSLNQDNTRDVKEQKLEAVEESDEMDQEVLADAV